jgi:hypothetical protein
MKSLIESLRQPVKKNVRKQIFWITEEILNMGVSVINSYEKDDQKFGLHHVLGQLVYVQIFLLLECNFYNVLLELSSMDDGCIRPEAGTVGSLMPGDFSISATAQDQLKTLNNLMYNLIPYGKVAKSNYLMNSINLNDTNFAYLKAKSANIFENIGSGLNSSEAVGCGNYKGKSKQAQSQFIFQCESLYLNMPSGFPSNRINKEVIDKIKKEEEGSFDEHKIANSISQSNILRTKQSAKWNFYDIYDIIDNIGSNAKLFQELSDKKFFRKLIKFYQPSQHQFIQLPWKSKYFIHAKVGYSLIFILLRNTYGRNLLSQSLTENFFEVNKSFLSELQTLIEHDLKYLKQMKTRNNASMIGDSFNSTTKQSLGQSAKKQEHPVILDFEKFNFTMIREYFSWIGLFTFSRAGIELLQEHDIFDL